MHARMRGHIASTGSPRSQCAPAMIKSTIPSSPLWRGCRAAAGWSENARKYCHAATHTLSLVIASHRRWRGNPVNYAPRVCDTYHKSLSICWGMALSGMIFSPIVFVNKNTAVINGGWRLTTIQTIASFIQYIHNPSTNGGDFV